MTPEQLLDPREVKQAIRQQAHDNRRAQADKERTVLLAEAERQASTIRGEGDAKATRTYAEAYGQSPEFYAFKRSLEAYESSLKDNTRLVLTPGSPFLRYFQ